MQTAFNGGEPVRLHDADGHAMDFDYIGTVEYEGEYYLLLAPAGEEAPEKDEEVEVTVLHINQTSPEEASFSPVTDEALLGAVIDAYNAMDPEITPSVLDALDGAEDGSEKGDGDA